MQDLCVKNIDLSKFDKSVKAKQNFQIQYREKKPIREIFIYDIYI
jgi:hypothetical protein